MPLADYILERAVTFIPVLLSLTVHEWAHAWTALKLGDDTAKMLGRVSLNPIDHIDPVGTLLLPLLGVPFGWAKPVPINPVRFRATISMPVGVLLVAAAGPISNLLLAVAGSGLLVALTKVVLPHNLDAYFTCYELLRTFVLVNVLLACFNLLPIPPLDGSRIVDALLPDALRPAWGQFTAISPLMLALVILAPLLTGVSLLSWPIHWVDQLLSWIRTL